MNTPKNSLQELTTQLSRIEEILDLHKTASADVVSGIIGKARQLKGLTLDEVAALLVCEDEMLIDQMLKAANFIKEEIYGRRLVLFAPLYYSNVCCNNCLYCAFRRDNKQARRTLSLEQIKNETRLLIDQGHKRVLVIAGEDPSENAFNYLLDVINAVYSVRNGRGEIRRINVEMAPMETEQFRILKDAKIGTYVVFQETYHTETYRTVHPSGPKSDYLWRLGAMDRAMQAGLGDVGIGTLFGLYDYRYDVLGLITHAKYLEKTYGVGPHTISVPRIEPADGVPFTQNPPFAISDLQLKKIVAILRMAVPYTGIILSTREPAELRKELFLLGVSQLSAGSRTNPGGYSEHDDSLPQFSIGDHRTLDEVIRNIAETNHIPSFCTACYRLKRTGKDFMDLAVPGEIRHHCDPNAISTFTEYLIDYASPETRKIGEQCIDYVMKNMDETALKITTGILDQIRKGKRDVFC